MKLSALIFLLWAWSLHLPCSAAQGYTAMFSFGDSLSDVGNFLVDGSNSSLDFAQPPYGMTFFGRPTGRCSDGRLVIDFLAEAFKLPLLPPSRAHGQSFRQGANFALTGATALDTSFFAPRGLGKTVWANTSLSTQIGSFEQMKPSLCDTTQGCKDYFARSLFVVGEIGGNDYNAYIFSGRSMEELNNNMPNVIEAISKGVERLIDLGAVDIVVPGMLPIGCFPLYLMLYLSPNGSDYGPNGCLSKFNTLASDHNALLLGAIGNLRSKYPSVRIVYADHFTPAMEFVLHPQKYGFTNGALTACCGAKGKGPYNVNLKARCGMPGSSACKNPSTYASWDGIHLTEAAYRYIAMGWLRGPYADPPIMSSPK